MTSPSDSEVARYQRVRALFEELADLSLVQQNERLTALRVDEPEVAAELEELLATDEPDTALLLGDESPIVRLLDDEPTEEMPRAVGRYEIRGVLGRGGMGAVFDAWDPKLERTVALKILPPEVAASADRLERFEREAKALAALRHPGVVTVYSVEHETGRHFFTMERIEGVTLAQRIQDGGLPLEVFGRWARELAEALAASHQAGIVHRDLKPANVMVEDETNRIRLVDFGLVKRLDTDDAPTRTGATASGMIMGTWRYMSPEQAKGEPADARSDVFSLGIVLYEMLTGASPFARSSAAEVAAATLHETHPPVAQTRPGVPRPLAAVVDRCLEKDPEKRFADATEVSAALDTVLEAPAAGTSWALRVAVGVLASLLVALGAFLWTQSRAARAEAEFAERVAGIEALQADRRQWAAYLATRELARERPQDPAVLRLLEELTITSDIRSEPAGARIAVRLYEELEGEWIDLGETPIEQRAMPNDVLVLRAELDGRRPVERLYEPRRGPLLLDLTADQADSGGPGDVDLVHIAAGPVTLGQLPTEMIPEFRIGRTEVTNAEYLRFVEAGGYRRAEFWTDPVVIDGETVPFDEVASRFVDASGRPGPSTWSAGTFPEGTEDLPVLGVSWFEARAYAAFAGLTLPSLYHWQLAAPIRPSDHMARQSNFNSDGPVPVASSGAVSPTGVHDLAGNAAEWVVNATEGGRFVVGSSWRDPRYSYERPVVRAPWERTDTLGLRVARIENARPEWFAALEAEPFDFAALEIASDEVFEAYRGAFDADPRPLDAEIEQVDETSPYWIRQKVSFAASYGDERIPGHLFLPRRSRPPHQVVVYFPSASAFAFESSEQLADLPIVDFIPRSGRAFFVPVFQGLYERRAPTGGPQGFRRRVVEMVQDLRRAVDYVEMRDDLDGERLGFASISLGSNFAPILLALEPRIDTAVLIAGGFNRDFLRVPAIARPWNYASRVEIPILMINGRGDQMIPLETGQRPMFERFGAPSEDKRHVVLDGGSLPDDQGAIAREALDWLDRYLGPVTYSDS